MQYIISQDIFSLIKSSLFLQLLTESFSQSDIGGSVTAPMWNGNFEADPEEPATGWVYFNTSSKSWFIFIAESWVEISLMEDMERIALEEVASYLRGRFDWAAILAAHTRNALLVMYITDIMLFHMYSRLRPKDVPDIRKERYNLAKEWLNQTNEGSLVPNLPEIEVSAENEYGSQNFRIKSNEKFNSQY
jgi:hypothetical protein